LAPVASIRIFCRSVVTILGCIGYRRVKNRARSSALKAAEDELKSKETIRLREIAGMGILVSSIPRFSTMRIFYFWSEIILFTSFLCEAN